MINLAFTSLVHVTVVDAIVMLGHNRGHATIARLGLLR